MRWRWLCLVAVAGLLAGACGSAAPRSPVGEPSTAAPTTAPATAPTTEALPSSTTPAPSTSAPAPTTTTVLANGVEAGRESIPWPAVGTGWFVAMWSPDGTPRGVNDPPSKAAARLYLVNPVGGRYLIKTFEAGSANGGIGLLDWSGDARRVLLTRPSGTTGTTTQIVEVDLATGATHGFTIDRPWAGGGYTRPSGKAIVLARPVLGTATSTLERVDLNGIREVAYPASLPTVGALDGSFLYTADGTALVVGATHGLGLLTNAGAVVRELPIPNSPTACGVERWWTRGEVLAACSDLAGPQLWIVPTSGAGAKALTTPPGGPDSSNGHVDAWALPSGTYVQDLGGCGSVFVGRLNADRTTTQVNVPGVDASSSVILLGTGGDRLAVETTLACGPGQSLLWFDPLTRATSVLLGPPVNGGGVMTALLFAAKLP